MKIYVDKRHRIKAIHKAPEGAGLREVDTDAFEGWPDVKVLCYCYREGDGGGYSVYPHMPWPALEASVGRGTEQQVVLAGLGVPADENMTGHAGAVRRAMDTALRELPDEVAVELKPLARIWNATATDGGVNAYAEGDKVLWPEAQMYCCLQAHTVDDPAWTPDTAVGLWRAIDETHSGSMDDPIPAVAGLTYAQGLHYAEGGVVYRYVWPTDMQLWQLPSALAAAGYFVVV